MTPTLTQLAALVPLDPTTLVLLTFALLPARWTAQVVTPALRRPWWLRVPIVGLALLSLMMPVLPWPAIALINAYLFLEAFAVATGPSSSVRRWLGLGAIAGFWSLQTFRTFWQTFFEPDGRAHFWFLDFFNKLYLALIDPLLARMGGAEARAAVLTYLGEPVAFFSNHLLAMHLVASLGGAVLLTHVLTGRLNATRDEPLEGPSLLEARMPIPVALCALAALLAHPLAPQSWAMTVLREIAGAALVWQGLAWAWVQTTTSRPGRAALVGLGIVVSLHPHLMGLVALVGASDSLLGLSARRLRDPERLEALVRQRSAAVRALRRAFGPAILALTLVPLATFPLVPLSHMVEPDPTSSARAPDAAEGDATASTVRVESTRIPPFEIDRYEHPNRSGELPTTGLTPAEAETRCQADGKTLCTSTAWYETCSNHGERFYVVPSYPYQASALSRLRRECNLRGADGAGTLSRSGERARCHGAYRVSDLAGNAYEWVRLPDLDGFWGLAGSYYRYSDAQTPACGFRVLVHEAQLGVIDLQATGFRCCR